MATKQQVKKRKELILTDFSNRLITTDYILRWFSLGIHRIFFDDKGGGNDWIVFVILQLFITAFTFIYGFVREYRYKISIEPITKEHITFEERWNFFVQELSQPPSYQIIGSTFSIILRVIFVITFCIMFVEVIYNLEDVNWQNYHDEHKRSIIAITFTVILFVYGGFVMYWSTISVPNVSQIQIDANLIRHGAKQPDKGGLTAEAIREAGLQNLVKRGVIQEITPSTIELMVDTNDIAIVEIEGDLKNLQNRVEAYILESVMFGALAFSGFLSLLASDKERLDYGQMVMFGTSLKKVLLDFLLLNFNTDDPAYYIFTSDERPTLIVWIMFITLFSSLCFLLVIASRLKFSSIIEKVDNAIRLARTYNDKEEEIYMLYMQFDDREVFRNRLEVLNRKIAQQINAAASLVKEVRPIVQYMSFFRNLGVLFFLVIIILGLLFYSSVIAGFVTFLSFMVYVYKQIDDWYRKNRLRQIISENQEAHYL